MSATETVLSFLRVFVWPVLIGVLVVGFRSPIRNLLRVRLSQIDAAGFSAKFEEATEQAERVAETARPRVARPRTAGQRTVGVGAVPDIEVVRITPRSYNDARQMGEAFREGKAVLMDLHKLHEADAKRFVDFAAGLVLMGRGSIERIKYLRFLITPARYLPPPLADAESRASGDDQERRPPES